MAETYEQAESVIVWLGEQTAQSSVIMSFLAYAHAARAHNYEVNQTTPIMARKNKRWAESI